MTLEQWAQKWGIHREALAEFRALLTAPNVIPPAPGETSEAAVQNRVRLEASRQGWPLWRNNVGVLKDERGVPLRFGLANDSAPLNAVLKSSDLIGIRPVLIGPEHLGRTIGQFVAREVKRPDWTYRGGKHEEAQLRFIEYVTSLGGDAQFTNGEGSLTAPAAERNMARKP